MNRQPNQVIEVGGEELNLMNINWTHHLDKAWQCNWRVNSISPKYEITYGATPEEAVERMKKVIAQYEPL